MAAGIPESAEQLRVLLSSGRLLIVAGDTNGSPAWRSPGTGATPSIDLTQTVFISKSASRRSRSGGPWRCANALDRRCVVRSRPQSGV